MVKKGKNPIVKTISFLLIHALRRNDQLVFTYSDIQHLLKCSRRHSFNYIKPLESKGFVVREKKRPATFKIVKLPESARELLCNTQL